MRGLPHHARGYVPAVRDSPPPPGPPEAAQTDAPPSDERRVAVLLTVGDDTLPEYESLRRHARAAGRPLLVLTARTPEPAAIPIGSPVHLLGHRSGVKAATKLAWTHPGGVASVALVGGASLPSDVAAELHRRGLPLLVLPDDDIEVAAGPLLRFWERWDAERVLLATTLTHDTAEVPRARRLLRSVLADVPLLSASRADDAELATSELVTNVVVHARTPAALRVTQRGDVLTITVRDAGPRQDAEPRLDHGRGLSLVAAVADRCGGWTDERGTTVWCWFDGRQPVTAPPDAPVVGSSAAHGSTAGAAAAPSEHESR